MTTPDPTPSEVSADTALRAQITAKLLGSLDDYEADFYADAVMDIVAPELAKRDAEIERLRGERDAARASSTQFRSNWDGCREYNTKALSTIAELRAALVSRPAIPDDAAEQIAERLREVGLEGNEFCPGGWFDFPVEEWLKYAAPVAEMVRSWLVAPATDPAPAADGLARLLWGLALTDERFVEEFGSGPSETRDALHEVMRQANALVDAPQATAEPAAPHVHDADCEHVMVDSGIAGASECRYCGTYYGYSPLCPDRCDETREGIELALRIFPDPDDDDGLSGPAAREAGAP